MTWKQKPMHENEFLPKRKEILGNAKANLYFTEDTFRDALKKKGKKNDIMQKGGGVESESFHLEPPRPSYYVNFFCSFPLMILIVNCWER